MTRTPSTSGSLPIAARSITFTFAFDPAEKGSAESVAGQKYNVPGLPTLYLIDRDGKVAAAFVGAQEAKLIEALAKVGVSVKEDE